METSEEIINKAIEKFNKLEHKELDWRSFYTGYLEAQAEQLALLRVVGQSEQFCECDGVQDLIAGTGECRKCGGQCTY